MPYLSEPGFGNSVDPVQLALSFLRSSFNHYPTIFVFNVLPESVVCILCLLACIYLSADNNVKFCCLIKKSNKDLILYANHLLIDQSQTSSLNFS